jgi:pimeloyl-ACP methyl ester carboxylesterase
MNHFVDRRLVFRGAVDIRAMPAIDTPKRCLVFVHGFGGKAISTWARFNSLLPSHPKVARADLIFYGYDGINVDVVASAGILRQFLSRLATDPDFVAASLPSDARKGFQRYEQIVLIAHSLGGVVARYAILDALGADDPWVDHAEMILFAPAHSGAPVARLVLAAFTGYAILPLLKSAVLFKAPAILQLKDGPSKEGFLKRMAERTVAASSDGHRQASAREVFFGQLDRIVGKDPFPGDPTASLKSIVPEATHASVCKPAASSDEPFVRLMELL